MKRYAAVIIILIWAVMQLSCNFPGAKPPVTTADLVNTAAALTVQAMGTEMASENPPMVGPSETAEPPLIGATETPTRVSVTPSPNVTPCDAAIFDADLTFPDGVVMRPGTHFTKIWRIKNTGSCTWNNAYSVVFKEGNAMGGTPSFSLQDTEVAAGETTTVSVDLIAPNTNGRHRGEWNLRNTKGVTFGKFWVEINVSSSAADEFVFADNMCTAEWRGGSEVLECPGDPKNEAGYAIRDIAPKFEGGYVDDEPAMVMSPPRSGGANEISGAFLPVVVPAGTHFRAVIGCLDDSIECDVTLNIRYSLEGGQEQSLGQWFETHDGDYQAIDVALDPLGMADKEVAFIFSVTANTNGKEHKVFWLRPTIGK